MISIQQAPRWLMVANAFKNALFLLPVIMLYYGYKGVDIGDFFLIQGLSWLFVFILEIPTGYIGDLFSRKNTVIIGSAIWILGYLCWILGFGFWWILLGELLFALAISLVSRTIEAYLYDLLKKCHKEGKFHKKLAKMEAVSNFSLMVATLLGAFIYQFFGPDNPILLSILGILICVIILLFLPDVPESKRLVEKDKNKWQDIIDITKYAVHHPQIKWLMLFPAFYGTLTLILMWGLQSVMIIQHIPVFMFSIVVGIYAFMRTFWSAVSGKMLEKISFSGTIKMMIILIVFASLASSLSIYVPVWAGYICLFLMILGSSSSILSRIITSILINYRIKSDERATILSIKSMIERALAGLGMIALKPLFDTIGVGETFIVSSILLIPILFLASKLYKMHLEMMK